MVRPGEQLTALHDFHARHYDAALGRWHAADPADQFNSPYTGMANNPVIATDPDGRLVPLLVFAGAALIGGGTNLWSNWDKVKDWKSGLAYFASGAVGGAVSVVNPAAGGAITFGGNIAVDVATGNMPDLGNPGEAAQYFGMNALGSIGVAGSGSLAKAGYNLAMRWGWVQAVGVSGQAVITGGATATGQTFSVVGPEVVVNSVRVPANTLLAQGGNFAAKKGSTNLFRAVSQAELDDIAINGIRNAPGYETGKLFATTAQDAANYGKLNFGLDKQPFTVIKTSIPKKYTSMLYKGEMDLMQAVSVPKTLFPKLSKPSIFKYVPMPKHPWIR